ncbi:MAG: ergothioneine biosynthesis protein EgtB [Bacteroidota bacterium]
MLNQQTLLSLPQAQLREQFLSVRSHSEALCAPLEIEDYVPQPVPFISPPKWHLAHTTWFFEVFLLETFLPDYQTYHPDFSFLFNSYYNAVGDRVFRADRGNITRPGVQEVYAYRTHVNEAMLRLLEREDFSERMGQLLILGLNHEQQHQELLITDLKYTFGHNPIFPVYREDFSLVNQYNERSGWVEVPEGVHEIGFQGAGFHWDNELGRHKVYLHAAELSTALVTHGEYLAFMADEGYKRADLWLDEGWSWVNEGQHRAPLYWHQIDGEWHHYTLAGLKKVDPNAILCHVNLYEAAAFAEWKGMRLPTEFEWEAVADQLQWGHRWEWTNSAYLPYPNFSKPPGAIGEYNGKFMVNQKVLRGGSTATSPGHSRKTYRNFFHAHLQWQCMGVRLARS